MPDESQGQIQVGDLGLILDATSFVPYYEQIVERIRNLIKENQLREGEVFCSEGEIADDPAVGEVIVENDAVAVVLVVIARVARADRGEERIVGDRSGQDIALFVVDLDRFVDRFDHGQEIGVNEQHLCASVVDRVGDLRLRQPHVDRLSTAPIIGTAKYDSR